MKSHWFKFISPLLILFVVHSANAIQQDSLQIILEERLTSSEFDQKEDILEYLKMTGELYSQSPTDALFYVTALEKKLDAEGNQTARAKIISQIAAFYWFQGVYDAALQRYFEALKLYKEENNSLEIVKTLNNIGETYKKQQDYKQSAKFIKLALEKLKEIEGFSPELITVNLGQLFLLRENFDSANYYLNQILKKENASTNSKGFTNLYKGILNREIGQYDSAHYYLNQSMSYWNELNYNRGLSESNIEIANIYVEEKNLKLANQYLNEAENLAIKINSLDLLLKIYQTKIDIFKITASNDSLVYYFDKYLEIKDSIFNSESRAEINKLSIQYNLAEKENDRYKLALEQAQLTNKIEKRTQFLIFLIVVLIFAVILILYLRNKSNQLKSAHIKLKQQKEEIEDKQRKISSKSLDLARVNKELHSLNKNLEQRVGERTQKLNERNRQIAEFTYFNSHKLRAPVASVLGLINVMELAKDGKIDPQLLNYLKTSAMELDKVIFNLKNLLELDDEIEEGVN